MTRGCPFSALRSNDFVVSSPARSNAGAGFSIIAEGSSWMSWFGRSEITKYPASTMNSTSGNR